MQKIFSLFKKQKSARTADGAGGATAAVKPPVDLDGIDPKVYKKRWWTLVAMCLALLGVMLANSSLNIALPHMSVDLGLTQLDFTWIVNIYTLVFASLLFMAGALGDRYGRKLAMQIGMVIFIIGSVYAATLAETATELIIARSIMGLGGALVMPTTLSIINNAFPRAQRARAVAIWSAIAGVGMMVGSIVSGVLLEHFSWHSLFYFSAIVAAVGFIANHFLSSESRDEEESPVDWLGGLFSAVGIFGLVYGITEAPSQGFADAAVLVALIAGVVGIATFILWELKVKSPMLDMKLFKSRSFSVSSLTLTLTFMAMAGVFFSMGMLMQLVLGMSPLESSLAMLPVMLPMLFISPIIPSIVKKFGARLTIGTGLFITSIAFVVMSTWTADMTYWQLLGVMWLMMLGISAAMTPGTNILMASVPRNRSGMGSAMNDTTRELGGALGVAILGAILSAAYADNIRSAITQFPAKAQEVIEGSLAGAIGVSQELGEAAGPLLDTAKEAWMSALGTASLTAAGMIFAASVITFIALPKHTSKDGDTL